MDRVHKLALAKLAKGVCEEILWFVAIAIVALLLFMFPKTVVSIILVAAVAGWALCAYIGHYEAAELQIKREKRTSEE